MVEIETRILDMRRRATVVGEVLPDAFRERGGLDSDLQRALRPEIEQAIHRSVREEPTVIAEAIYPVMGPVIRRIVQRLFEGETRGMLKPYRVEQLFLIHRGSGLVIAHHVADGAVARDADMISGMLDAIRSFVQDAFDAHEFDGLDSMRIGEVNVRIEWSPSVVLAAVVRGLEPSTLQPALEAALARFHERHGEEFERFDGDDAPFENLSTELERVLRASAPPPTAAERRPWLTPLALTALTIAVIGALARMHESADWERALAALASAPGIVVTEHERGWRHSHLYGLRDADAADPLVVIAAEGVDRRGLDHRWEPFLSDDPIIKRRRATRVLDPPEGVELTVDGRELQASGTVPRRWLGIARETAPTIDGIDHLRVLTPMEREP